MKLAKFRRLVREMLEEASCPEHGTIARVLHETSKHGHPKIVDGCRRCMRILDEQGLRDSYEREMLRRSEMDFHTI